MYRTNRSDSGFTIVELLMAMAFVSVLLVVITLTVIQISNTYNKGLTMRAVDQAGRAISADIRQTLSQGQPIDVASTGHLCRQTANGGCTQNTGDVEAGRLCTGQYSYIWNLGTSINSTNPPNIYKVNKTNRIHFIRVRDGGSQYCAAPDAPIDDSPTGGDPREFLNGEEADLVVQSFNIKEMIRDDAIGQALYNVTLEVGTNGDGTINNPHIDSIDASCKPPSDDSALVDFCAVNRFDFTVQAGNQGGGQ
jgi:type II secretory pathway pseudopilin PulG